MKQTYELYKQFPPPCWRSDWTDINRKHARQEDALAINCTFTNLLFLNAVSSATWDSGLTMTLDLMRFSEPNSVELDDRLGDLLRLSTTNRIMSQNIAPIIHAFQNFGDDADGGWRGEYWGKWCSAAILSCQHRADAQLDAEIHHSAGAILATQAADGYIGTVTPEKRLSDAYPWDFWCRSYVLLGLIAYYKYSDNSKVLERAIAFANGLIKDVSEKHINVSATGLPVLQGLASSCILEPISLLYACTRDDRYLSFARRLVSEWEEPNRLNPAGLGLVTNALERKPPIRNHAYATMSCIEGLCEFYRATGEKRFLDAAVRFGESVLRYERMIHGSVSNQELFCGGATVQMETLEQPVETCATVAWMRLCTQLLRLTGESRWADELELSLYNALLGAQMPDCGWWAYFSPLIGERVPSHFQQQDVELSCCVASGPRGLQMTPRWAVMTGDQTIYMNLYASGEARIVLPSGQMAVIKQTTNYPREGWVQLSVSCRDTADFTVALRMPTWSKDTRVSVNGEPMECTPGEYLRIRRQWKGRTQLSITFDMRGRAIKAPSGGPELAVMRGPIVLALDNRYGPDTDVDVRLSSDAEGLVDIELKDPDVGAWICCMVRFEVHPSHFFNHYSLNIPMIDLASAGNAWSPENTFRTWLPQPLYLPDAFPKRTWKLQYPEGPRPTRDRAKMERK